MYMHECLSRWYGLRRIKDREICEAVAGVLATARSATEGDYADQSVEDRLEAILMAVDALERAVATADPPEPQGEPDPETDRDRFCGPLDRDDPPERPERPYFDPRDHFSDWGRP